MQNLSYVLDVLLVLDCIAAVAFSFLIVRSVKRRLENTPPYEKAIEKGLPDYKLSGRLYDSLYGKLSYKRDAVTPEVEYEAYRQDVFSKSLLRLMAVNFAFAVIADICCFFDGFEADGYTLGFCTALCGLIAGTIAGALLGLYLSRIAYKSRLAETVSRSDWFVKEDGSLRRGSKYCYFSAYLTCIPSCWCLAATICFTVYTVILMIL